MGFGLWALGFGLWALVKMKIAVRFRVNLENTIKDQSPKTKDLPRLENTVKDQSPRTKDLPPLGFVNRLFNATPWARQSLTSGISPTCQNQAGELRRRIVGFALVEERPDTSAILVMLCLFCTAMLAQPPISEVEEVVGFIHRSLVFGLWSLVFGL